MHTGTEILADSFLRPFPPKAAQLIVTIYGDIVEPRGGVLWMGDLISLCAGFSVNESLVRTAVSRLVSKGQLKGEREGRRSFYASDTGCPGGSITWLQTCFMALRIRIVAGC